MAELDGVRVSRKDGGRRCPYCRDSLEEARECADCGTGYHAACWGELGGCATLGCRGIVPAGGSCRKCRQTLEATQLVLSCNACQEPYHADCWIAGSICSVPKCEGRVEFVKATAEWAEPPLRSTPVLRAPAPPRTCYRDHCDQTPRGVGSVLFAHRCVDHSHDGPLVVWTGLGAFGLFYGSLWRFENPDLDRQLLGVVAMYLVGFPLIYRYARAFADRWAPGERGPLNE